MGCFWRPRYVKYSFSSGHQIASVTYLLQHIKSITREKDYNYKSGEAYTLELKVSVRYFHDISCISQLLKNTVFCCRLVQCLLLSMMT